MGMGENEISAANMEKILSSVGVEADKERLSQVVAACAGKSTEELIAAGLPSLLAWVVAVELLLLQQLLVLLLLLLLKLLLPRRRRKRRSLRRRTMTWASDSLTSLSAPVLTFWCCQPDSGYSVGNLK